MIGIMRHDRSVSDSNAALATAAWRTGIPGMLDTVQHNPQDVDTRIHLGSAYLVTAQPQKAAPQFQAILQIQPGNRNAKFLLATALGQEGKKSAAKSVFAELAQTDDKFGRAAKKYL